jgi:PAS domain S-box-containing protein
VQTLLTESSHRQGRGWSTERKIQIGFVFALICLGVSGAISYLSVLHFQGDAARIEHTYQVMNILDTLLVSMTEAQIGGRRYVTLGHTENMDRYRQGVLAVHEALPKARRLIADDSAQLQRLSSIEQLATSRLADLAASVAIAESQGIDAAQRVDPSDGRRLYDEFRTEIEKMKAIETSRLRERQARGRQAAVAAEAVSLVAGILAIFVAGSALIAIRRDFAGRARAQETLRRTKDELELRVAERTGELRGIVESSDDAIITKTLDGLITSWNPGAERIFGYSAEQAIGQSMQIIIPPERSREEPAILARLAQGERVDHFETVRVRADGSRIDVSATISPLHDGSGRIIGASKIARDITERKAHERKDQAQFERLNLLQHITHAIRERQDLKSIYQVVTRSLEEQMPVDFACIAPYDAATKTLQVAYTGKKNDLLAHELAERRGRISIEQNGLGRCARGELVYEPDVAGSTLEFPVLFAQAGLRSLVLTPLSFENKVFAVMIIGRCKPSTFTSTDCEFLRQLSEHLALASHQAELHGSLQQAYDDLRQTQQAVMQQERLRALGQMASGVAHDINNALSPPALYVQMLLEHEKSIGDEGREYLRIIERSLQDVANTIARLRMFYRPSDQEPTLSSVDLNELLVQIIEVTRARWSTMPQEHGFVVDLKRDLGAGLPRIMGAESEIRDALTNLVFNAVDAMPRGGVLMLRSEVVPAERGATADTTRKRVAIEVSDTGVGMTEEVRTRCLEPFFTTKGERGTGLGLAMVYGMAQRHGADLEIDSEPGAGTTMRLVFPAVIAEEVAEVEAYMARASTPRRILVVDDDPLVLKSLRTVLEADGHTVDTADGGREGIDRFSAARQNAEPFAVVFTDLGMPNVDGRVVAQAIKAAAPDTPVILLTGWGQRLRDESELPQYIDRVLSKPPKLMEVRAALAELVRTVTS